ncbi:MAG: spore germination protein [Anaerotignum sp.]|nr:spore germination protein [Anaerotignum sp.]
MQLTKELEQNMAAINEALRDCGDIVRREFRIGGNGKLLMLYADNFVDLEAIRESILETIMLDYQNQKTEGLLQILLEEALVKMLTFRK